LLLTELEGFNERGNVVVVGATNRPWDLSQNLLRRFEKKFFVTLPDKVARKTFIQNLVQNGKFKSNITDGEIDKLAEDSDLMSCDDLRNTYNKVVDWDAVQPVMEANHFTQKEGGEEDLFAPCSCKMESCARLLLEDLPSSCVIFQPLTIKTFKKALNETTKSNSGLSLEKFEHFKKFGTKLNEEAKKSTTETTGAVGGWSTIGVEIFCLFSILATLFVYLCFF
jgi:vacuolar protein-sorting-associated protein 4